MRNVFGANRDQDCDVYIGTQVREDVEGRSRGFGFVTFSQLAAGVVGVHNIGGRDCEVRDESRPLPQLS